MTRRALAAGDGNEAAQLQGLAAGAVEIFGLQKVFGSSFTW